MSGFVEAVREMGLWLEGLPVWFQDSTDHTWRAFEQSFKPLTAPWLPCLVLHTSPGTYALYYPLVCVNVCLTGLNVEDELCFV